MKDFLRGMSTIFDLFPQERKKPSFSSSPFFLNDEEALKSDWEQIGNDIGFAMDSCSSEISKMKV